MNHYFSLFLRVWDFLGCAIALATGLALLCIVAIWAIDRVLMLFKVQRLVVRWMWENRVRLKIAKPAAQSSESLY